LFFDLNPTGAKSPTQPQPQATATTTASGGGGAVAVAAWTKNDDFYINMDV